MGANEMDLKKIALNYHNQLVDANCVLCGNVLDDPYGHNPAPLAEEGRCCGECNFFQVLPTRMGLHFELMRKLGNVEDGEEE